MDQGGNYWTLFTPGIWKVLHAVLQRKRDRLKAPPRALTDQQQQAVLDQLHEPRFADQAPAEIYATLLDEGVYHCLIGTMCRTLDRNSKVCRRRAIRFTQSPNCWPRRLTKYGLGISPS